MKFSSLRRLLALALAAALLLTGCGKATDNDDDGDTATTPTTAADNATLYPYDPPVAHAVGSAYDDEDYGFQLDAPAAGEEIAVLHTNFGDIAIRLFPDGAPQTVANFKALVRRGYYNGLSFHRIINDFMIQSGDPNGDGTGGTSSTGGYVPDEFDQKLLNLRGALSMANPGIENRNGSQFFINQCRTNAYSETTCADALASYQANYSDAMAAYHEYYEQYEDVLTQRYQTFEDYFHANYYLAPLPDTVPAEVWELYNRVGGNIHLDGPWRSYGGHTVFGQVFDGMDVVDAIAAIATNEQDNSPLYQVTITSAEIVTYDPATYHGSGVLTPELIPVEDKSSSESAAAPVYPLGEQQLSTAHTVGDAYADRAYGFQLEAPAPGEEIAVLHTSKGDIRMRLFPEAAPQTVANFKALIRRGFYNGLSFHYVVDDFLIQSGDPDGSGSGGASSTGGYIPDEFDKKLLNLRGALSMGNTGVQNTATSQFFINQARPTAETAQKSYWTENEEQWTSSYDTVVSQCATYYTQNEATLAPFYGTKDLFVAANTTLAPHTKWVPAAVWDLYQQNGGNIHLDGQWREYGGNTVFGQVFDGMEVVDAIAAVPTDENGKPTEEVTILSAELVAYNGR